MDLKSRDRYRKHVILPEIGEAGQQRLLSSSILVIGAGGLGCAILPFLASAGVGKITIVDDDVIDSSNLQRQVLYREDDCGQKKAVVAAARVSSINPGAAVTGITERLTIANADDLVSSHDLVIDGCDNFDTRYLVNDACVRNNKAFISGAIESFSGQVSVFNYKGGPTYRCLFPSVSPEAVTCSEGGVLASVPAVAGSVMATEALKILSGCGEPLSGKLFVFDVLTNLFDTIAFERSELQPASPTACREISYGEVISRGPENYMLVDLREAHEFEERSLPGAINQPLTNVEVHMQMAKASKKPVVFFCERGIKSAALSSMIKEAESYSLRGGINAALNDR